ncbi:MAG: hypothetical protein KGS61_17225 [Verrucomicrobia bacterium]|nr:hypothetical protein [Verrucomicrobiota bacterium]
MKRSWLEPYTWAVIVETNRQLCQPKGALHKPTSDGYEPTRQLWESRHCIEMSLSEAADLCGRCQRLAPFCNFNGDTFAAVIRRVIAVLPFPADQATALRVFADHIVAGTATLEEQRTFERVSEELWALDAGSEMGHGSVDELAGHHCPLAETPAPRQNPSPLGEHPRAGGEEHGLRGRTGESADPARDTRPERATRFLETTRGVLSYSQLAPLLAERVVAVQGDIERGGYFAALEAADQNDLHPLVEIWKRRLAAAEPPNP